ncbi:hypothetical protein F4604DRAFT_2008768 [Suillus subluteus]|nr:hypothetical protein F4604DRAFT_2008768 [Suillus subluteus]
MSHSRVPTRKPLMNSNATQRPPIQARRVPQGFFLTAYKMSSAARGSHPRSPAEYPRSTRTPLPLAERLSLLFRQPHSDTDGTIELQRRPRRSIFSHRDPRIVEVPTVQDRKPAQKTQQHAQSHGQGSSTIPPVPGTDTATLGEISVRSQLVRLLALLQQSQGQAQTRVTSSQTQYQQGQPPDQTSCQTQLAAPSMSVSPTALNVHTTVSGAASRQPRPLPLQTRLILFICCTSLPHAVTLQLLDIYLIFASGYRFVHRRK